MDRRSFLRPLVMVALLLAACGLGGLAPAGPTRARASIECAPPASPAAATPKSSAATPVAEVAFPDEGELTIFAAASLTAAFNRIITDIEAAHPGITFTEPNYAGSQALVTQLSEGAEADVFASASGKQMTAAVDAGVIDGTHVTFTQNRLALIVPKDNPVGITSLADLSKDGVKLILALPDVPVGQYARESICKAAADTATYGEGFVDAVAANVVSEEDNVKAVVAKVQAGSANSGDAGIVYTTDITDEVAGDVTVIEIPEAVNVIAKYPIAPVAGGDAELAAAFIGYVLGPDGQATLRSFGFEPRPAT